VGQVFQVVGQEVTQNDPEFAKIEAAMNNPKGSEIETLLVISEQAKAKAARVLAQKDTAKARVTGGGGSTTSLNDISGINDSEKLYEIGDQRIRSKK
jgi:hypothetical protein